MAGYRIRSVAEEVEDMRKLSQELMNDPEKSRQFFYDAGITNMDGSFTERYKELEQLRVSK
jgi:hypothetical protein